MDGYSFMSRILILRIAVDFSVTSWFRTKKRNVKVGGATNSYHLDGLAVDVVLDNSKDYGILLEKCTVLGLKVLNEGDHIHIQAMQRG